MVRLTSKQSEFCRHVSSGSSLAEAYRKSYDATNMKPSTVRREAHSLMKNPNIATTLDRLQREAEIVVVNKTIANRTEVLETLTGIMRGEVDADSHKLRATQLLAQAHGVFRDQPKFKAPLKSSEEILQELHRKLSSLTFD